MALAKVQDLIIGANFTGQFPFTDMFLFKAIVGYNYGTGAGNSGVMTSKTNSSYYITGQTDWYVGQSKKHDIILGLDFKGRTASISGKVGAVEDTWDTKSTMFGFRGGYAYTF
jgi:hypothetical protein